MKFTNCSALVLSLFFTISASATSKGTSSVLFQYNNNDEFIILNVEGDTAEEVYQFLNVKDQDGIKNAPGITCVKEKSFSTFCTMLVRVNGEVEGNRLNKALKY